MEQKALRKYLKTTSRHQNVEKTNRFPVCLFVQKGERQSDCVMSPQHRSQSSGREEEATHNTHAGNTLPPVHINYMSYCVSTEYPQSPTMYYCGYIAIHVQVRYSVTCMLRSKRN